MQERRKRNNIVDASYWIASYKGVRFQAAPRENVIRKWLLEFRGHFKGDCFEVGCYPGTYFSIFGELGCSLSGIDLFPGVKDELSSWLKNFGYRVLDLYCGDFLKFTSSRKYDVVCSFGFLEHFINWKEVLLKHANLVSNGGILVISVPNFRGIVQRAIHFYFNRENLLRHNLAAMDPSLWVEQITPLGFETVFCGYIGGFHFWVDNIERGFFPKVILRILTLTTPYLKKALKSSSSVYSSHCGIIMKRNSL